MVKKHGVGYLWGCHSKTLSNINDKRRDTRYKPRDAGTDTADHGHRYFAFHDARNRLEFATNSLIKI